MLASLAQSSLTKSTLLRFSNFEIFKQFANKVQKFKFSLLVVNRKWRLGTYFRASLWLVWPYLKFRTKFLTILLLRLLWFNLLHPGFSSHKELKWTMPEQISRRSSIKIYESPLHRGSQHGSPAFRKKKLLKSGGKVRSEHNQIYFTYSIISVLRFQLQGLHPTFLFTYIQGVSLWSDIL